MCLYFADAWITTDGMASSPMSRCVGETVSQSDADRKPVLIGFPNLRDVINRDDIQQKSHDVTTAGDNQVTSSVT